MIHTYVRTFATIAVLSTPFAHAWAAPQTTTRATGPVVADHTIVDDYWNIPQSYLDEVHKMLFAHLGQSHSRAIPYGFALLAAQDPRFHFSTRWTGGPEAPTTQHLRLHKTYRNQYGAWKENAGEQHFWTSNEAVTMMSNCIGYAQNTLNNPFAALCFGWCWDMSDGNVSGGWAGEVFYPTSKTNVTSPWDINTTTPCLMDYLAAVEHYNATYPNTVTMFSTGPVEASGGGGESGYQRWLKNEAIRNHVNTNGGYLLDYADILCWSNGGQLETATWNGHTFPKIHSNNNAEYDAGQGSCHISAEGCLRVAKATVWLLARIAGWGEEPLTSSAPSISASAGGVIDYYVDAGAAYAGRSYVLLGAAGTTPGTPLPGGLTMPLNYDWFSQFVIGNINYPIFQNFWSTLDANGQATGVLNTGGPIPLSMVGTQVHFAFMLITPFDFVSNTVPLSITG